MQRFGERPGLETYWETANYHQKGVLFIVNYLALYPRPWSRDPYILSLDK